MSVEISDAVWKYSQSTGTARLILLCLADHADAAGESFPSIASIARKCRLKDGRHVQRVIRKLVALGELSVVANGGRSGRLGGVRTNRYRITLQAIVEAPTPDHRPPSTTPDSGPPTTPTPVGRPPESSVNRQMEPSLRARSPERSCRLISDDFRVTDEMRRWCADQGIRSDPDDEVVRFIDHHRARGRRSSTPLPLGGIGCGGWTRGRIRRRPPAWARAPRR